MKLNIRILFAFVGLILLIIGILFGYPLEINDLRLDRIFLLLFSIIIILTFFFLFYSIHRFNNKWTQRIFKILLIIIGGIYSLNGLWILLISYKDGPKWEDRLIYSNNNTKIVYQFRETSGSIYDYRNRLIIYEKPKRYRISIDWSEKFMDGKWMIKDLSNDSIFIKTINKN